MAWDDVSLQERDRLLKLYEERNAESIIEEASLLNIEPQTLARRCREHRLYRRRYVSEQITFPDYGRVPYNDFIVLSKRNAIVISDLEIPDVDPKMLKMAMLFGLRYGVRDLIIAGDTVATDQPSLKTQVDLYREEGEITYRHAIAQTKMSLMTFLLWFNQVWMIQGNHDHKMNRSVGGEIDIGMFLEDSKLLDGRVKFSRYSRMYLEVESGIAMICHPSNYSNNSIDLGRKIYNKTRIPGTRKKPDILVLGHTHQSMEGSTSDGLCSIYGLGCMRDADRTQYVNESVTTYPEWTQGFGMFYNGHFHNFCEGRTDWKFYLGDLYKLPAE